MYAIVEIAGQQFKVEKDKKIYVHRLEGEVDSHITFDKVLLVDQDYQISIGTPVLGNAKVEAKILSHVKGDKVIVFKKIKRKGFQKSNGHRQQFTQIHIENIVL